MAKKLAFLFFLICGVFGVGIIYLFTASFDSPELGHAVLARASEATGVNLQAQGFRLNLRTGLSVYGVTAEGAFPGGRYRIELDEIRCETELMPLLSGKVQIERVLLDTPRVEIIQGGPAESAEPASSGSSGESASQSESSDEGTVVEGSEGDEAPSSSLEISVSEIRLEDAAILFGDGETAELQISDFDLVLTDLDLQSGALTAIHGLSSKGEFTMSEMKLEALSVRELDGDLEMAGGRFSLNEVHFQLPQGDFETTMELDFNSFPFTYEMSLAGDPIDANQMLGAGADGGFGPASLEMQGRGVGTDPANFKADGKLVLSEGTLPSTATLSAVETSLGRTNLIGAPYQATEVPFRVANHRLTIERLELLSPELGIDAKGTVDLAGPLNLTANLKTPREQLNIKEVRDEVLDVLTDDEGFVLLPYALRGSIEEPKLQVDARALGRQARAGTGRVAKEKILEGISGLFGRKKKKN